MNLNFFPSSLLRKKSEEKKEHAFFLFCCRFVQTPNTRAFTIVAMDISLLNDVHKKDKQVNAQQRFTTKRQLQQTNFLLANSNKQQKREKNSKNDKNPGVRYRQAEPEIKHREILENFALSRHDRTSYPQSAVDAYTLNFMNWMHARDIALAHANEKDNQSRERLEQEKEAKRVRQDRAKHVRLFSECLQKIDPEHGQRSKMRHEMVAYADIKQYFASSDTNETLKTRQTYKNLYYELVVDNITPVNFNAQTPENQEVADKETGKCGFCNGTLVVDHVHGSLSCIDCGASLNGGEGVGFKETYAERQQSSARIGMPYARVSHFKEFLTRLEGTERTIIPDEVILSLLRECQQLRIDPVQQPEKITYRFVRYALRRTQHCNYFENIPQLIARITQRPVHYFSEEQRSLLINIFEMIQVPFKKHKGKRKNFLSYAYILYKFCELLDLPEFLPFLPLLKAPENLLATDLIWEKICQECNFEYIPTRWTNGI